MMFIWSLLERFDMFLLLLNDHSLLSGQRHKNGLKVGNRGGKQKPSIIRNIEGFSFTVKLKSLKFSCFWCSRKCNHITNVCHPGYK